MPSVRKSTLSLPRVLHATGRNRAATSDRIELATLEAAARYLKDEFDASFKDDLAWSVAAKALETAQRDPSHIPFAMRALEFLLWSENRIELPDPVGSDQAAQSG